MSEYEKEYLRDLGKKCIEYIKGNKIYKEDGYWKDLIFYLEKEQYGYFIKKVLNSFVYGVTCVFAYKMLEVLNKSTTSEKSEHELLGLYRKLSKELNLEVVIGCDSWDGIHDFETLECQVDDLSLETFKQILTLEKELEEVK
jgi:hypothetical protein